MNLVFMKKNRDKFSIWIPFTENRFICFLIDPKNTDDTQAECQRLINKHSADVDH